MTGVINLRQFKKARARDEKRARGDANAALYGRSKLEKDVQAKQFEEEKRHLDGHILTVVQVASDD